MILYYMAIPLPLILVFKSYNHFLFSDIAKKKISEVKMFGLFL